MKDLKIYLFIATILLVLYVTAQYNRPKGIDWEQRLLNTDKTPFGTYILYNRINDIFPGANVKSFREPVYNVLNDHNINTATYIIICNNIDLNKYDHTKLVNFIKKGNDVFIASYNFGGVFNKYYKVKTNSEYKRADTRLINRFLDTGWVNSTKRDISNTYFSDFDTVNAIILGKNSFHNINFLKYNIGKGSLYLNANPSLFSNYALVNEQARSYAQSSLSYLKNSNNILWDEYYTAGRGMTDNPMRVFLEHYQLKWAFYLAYFSLFIFVVYQVKRRQRIIPVVEPLKNATLDFVTVVGQVYYEQRNNNDISQKKILYFLDHLRVRYNLKTSTLDAEFAETLAKKTGINSQFATKLVNWINYINQQPQVTDHELIVLNQLIEKFYSQS